MLPSGSNSPLRTLRRWIAAAAVIALAPTVAVSEGTDEERLASKPGLSQPSAPPAASPEPGRASTVGDQVVDAAVMRPLGALSLVGGAIFFVVTSPLVLVSRVIDYRTSWDVMVMAPWEYTVERPLGDL